MIAGTSDFIMVFFHQRPSFFGPQPVHFRPEISKMSILTAIFCRGVMRLKFFGVTVEETVRDWEDSSG